MADVKLEARENSQKALTFTILAADIEKAYSQKLNKYANDMTFKGFRKGKAPLSFVEHQIGEYVREEVTYDMIDECFSEKIKSLEFADQPLAYAKPVIENEESLKPFKKDQDITCTIRYDVFPEVKLGQYTGLSLEVLNSSISDKDIDDEIESLREQNANILTKEGKSEKGDIITIDYCELDENSAPVESTRRNDFTFTIGSSYNQYKIDDDVTGLAVGDEKTITKTYGEDESDSSLRGRTVSLSVKVTKLKERVLPEVDDDFAQDVKEEYKTVADLREGIRKNLAQQMETTEKDEKFMTLFKELKKSCTFTLPESMKDFAIRTEVRNYMRQMGRSAQEIDDMIDRKDPTALYVQAMVSQGAISSLEQQVIIHAIQQQGVIKPSDEDLEKAYEGQIRDDMDEETKERAKKEIRDDLEFSKVPEWLLENNTFTKTGDKLGYKEYMDAFYKKLYEPEEKSEEAPAEEKN